MSQFTRQSWSEEHWSLNWLLLWLSCFFVLLHNQNVACVVRCNHQLQLYRQTIKKQCHNFLKPQTLLIGLGCRSGHSFCQFPWQQIELCWTVERQVLRTATKIETSKCWQWMYLDCGVTVNCGLKRNTILGYQHHPTHIGIALDPLKCVFYRGSHYRNWILSCVFIVLWPFYCLISWLQSHETENHWFPIQMRLGKQQVFAFPVSGVSCLWCHVELWRGQWAQCHVLPTSASPHYLHDSLAC